ncbi:MAG: GNAT family N-acetyltransferase [Planctomycetes bacterium]|nr:GNAT family N-acetyltransferase [Planctomycetota bacterium]
MGWNIRSYRAADRDDVLRITVESFTEVAIERNIERRFGPIRGRDWKWRKARQVDRELTADPAGAFIAESDGRVAAYVTTWSDIEAGVGFIPNLAVDGAYRNQGIGRALIDRALTHFRSLGLTHARIETLDQNPVGPTLYPACGFTEVARQIHYCRALNER